MSLFTYNIMEVNIDSAYIYHRIQSTKYNTYASTNTRRRKTRTNATATPSPTPEKTKPHHLLTTTRENFQALKTRAIRHRSTESKTLNEQRQSSPGRRSKHHRHRDGAPATDPPTFDQQTRAGRGATQARNPPSTYLSSPTPTMEETAAQRQRARGKESHITRASSPPRRPRGDTPTDPSPTHPASTRGGRI